MVFVTTVGAVYLFIGVHSRINLLPAIAGANIRQKGRFEMEHTPRPWTARILPHPNENNQHWIDAAGHIPIANVFDYYEDDNGEEGIANAHLIAAAPDLLEACKEFYENFTVEYDICDYTDGFNRSIDKIVLAIAKAEGKEV